MAGLSLSRGYQQAVEAVAPGAEAEAISDKWLGQ